MFARFNNERAAFSDLRAFLTDSRFIKPSRAPVPMNIIIGFETFNAKFACVRAHLNPYSSLLFIVFLRQSDAALAE